MIKLCNIDWNNDAILDKILDRWFTFNQDTFIIEFAATFGIFMNKTTNKSLEQPTQTTANNQVGTISRGFLNVLLVFLESAITLALRFDPKLRELAYPLASGDKVVCIRTYLPHTQLYASFGYRGVLLDDRLPAHKPNADMTINAYSFQLLGLLTNHNPASVDGLQIRGDTQDVAHLKAFLVRLGIGGAVQTLLEKIKGKQHKPTEEERQQKRENYKAKIIEQEKTISQLRVENDRLSTSLIELKSKQQSTKTALIIACLVALVALVLHFFI